MTTTTIQADLLDALEAQIEQQLQLVLRRFQNLSNDELLRPAADGGWGIAECIEHLNTYGRYYLPLIAERVAKAPHQSPSRPFRSGWLGNYFTEMMKKPAAEKKLKAAKMHRPVHIVDAHAVVAEFVEQQEQFLRLLRQGRNLDWNGSRISVSIFRLIRLKIGDICLFLAAHNERHLQQALRG